MNPAKSVYRDGETDCGKRREAVNDEPLNDYLAMNYRMEIVEDKDDDGFVVSSGMYYL